VPETRSGTYVLQAGSYKNFADADASAPNWRCRVSSPRSRRSRWTTIPAPHPHRPISNLDELNHLRSVLRKADVDVLVIRVGD